MDKEIIFLEDFAVHFDFSGRLIKFQVYPVFHWKSLGGKEQGTYYIDKENEPDTRDEFEEGKCLMKFQGSYVWRGVWEGRLYFTDIEYWGHELEELSKLYTNHIEPKCKAIIKKKEPDTNYN